MLVRDVMSAFPAVIRTGADVRRAAELLSVSEVGHLMVLDADDRFVGQLAEDDLIRALVPDLDGVLAAGATMADAFRVFAERGREVADRPIDPLVRREAVTVGPDDPLAKVAVALLDRGMRRIPVVVDGTLLGTVSRADVCRAVLYHA
ncbi:CBS domain-containing protein [Pseudonocardia oroxyli]|uniref:CBS domain-containing protein n=1 Tax=Pseudonocardia oroxyli TaxID=366584 RepID=A0A1G7VU90_PSEOR|nr:CBS domain-containing protein [Pseudonocardia oroxyli]SDG63364.1 CBS domain-containing protein [Pseudonocardia oroxyli]